jgi:general secretion pathway protein C
VSVEHLLAKWATSSALRSVTRARRIARLDSVDCVKAMLLIGIAYTAVSTASYLFGAPLRDTPAATRSASAAKSAPIRSLDDVVAANLFGVARSTMPQSVAIEQAAEARLRLQGTFEASGGTPSVAIVSEGGRPGIPYRLGEQLPGAATLSEVGPGRIVLDRSGRREALEFELAASAARRDESAVSDAPPTEAAEPDNAVADAEGVVESVNVADEKAVKESYVRRIMANPRAAIEEFGLREVTPGQANGYQVVQRTPYFDRIGVREGDVIVAVNGAPVGSPELDHLELANLIAAGSTGVTIERDGHTLNLTSADDPLEARRKLRQETASR